MKTSKLLDAAKKLPGLIADLQSASEKEETMFHPGEKVIALTDNDEKTGYRQLRISQGEILTIEKCKGEWCSFVEKPKYTSAQVDAWNGKPVDVSGTQGDAMLRDIMLKGLAWTPWYPACHYMRMADLHTAAFQDRMTALLEPQLTQHLMQDPAYLALCEEERKLKDQPEAYARVEEAKLRLCTAWAFYVGRFEKSDDQVRAEGDEDRPQNPSR